MALTAGNWWRDTPENRKALAEEIAEVERMEAAVPEEPCMDGWRWDETACGDPDHCSPVYPCACNPSADHDHECAEDCH